jgi:hypothetical protein
MVAPPPNNPVAVATAEADNGRYEVRFHDVDGGTVTWCGWASGPSDAVNRAKAAAGRVPMAGTCSVALAEVDQ